MSQMTQPISSQNDSDMGMKQLTATSPEAREAFEMIKVISPQ